MPVVILCLAKALGKRFLLYPKKSGGKGPPARVQFAWRRVDSLASLYLSQFRLGGNSYMRTKTRILVTGAGGFIGHHLVKRLRADGHWVRGVDIKRPEYEETAANEFELLDLRLWHNALLATRHIDQVYNLAADMGGIGYITGSLADIARNNILINAHILEASRVNRRSAVSVFVVGVRVRGLQAGQARK